MARKPLDIALHIVYNCIGDNCECCDWPADDRAALEGMTLAEADALATSDDRPTIDYENHVDGGRYDLSDDAEALASAGWGTDEDYGYFGDD